LARSEIAPAFSFVTKTFAPASNAFASWNGELCGVEIEDDI
jgi:hypothetical protein